MRKVHQLGGECGVLSRVRVKLGLFDEERKLGYGKRRRVVWRVGGSGLGGRGRTGIWLFGLWGGRICGGGRGRGLVFDWSCWRVCCAAEEDEVG